METIECPWIIQVANNNPEPDSPSDCYDEVPCGAPATVNEHGSWRCEAGHWHTSYADPGYSEEDVIAWERAVESTGA